MGRNQLTGYLLLLATILTAQSDLKIGQWKSHLPYFQGRSITQSESTVYYASPWAIFMLDKEERSPDFMSKVEGLSDVGMGVIKYVPAHETLIATYQNSNVDFISPEGVFNLPFIKEDANIIGDREIYNIYLATDDLAYLATGFGVVELNVARKEFGFTTKMNLKVNDITSYNGSFYAATDEGIYRALNDGITNLQDFGNWVFLGEDQGFPESYATDALEVYNDKLYIDVNDTLYSYFDGGLNMVYEEQGFEITFLTAEGSHLLTGMSCLPDCTGKVLFFDENESIKTSGSRCVSRTNYAIEDQAGRIWYSDRWDDIRIADSTEGDCSRENFNSPYTHHAIEIVIDEGNIYLATETPPSNSTNGFYEFKDGNWNIFNALFYPELQSIKAAYRIAVHPIVVHVIALLLASEFHLRFPFLQFSSF